MRFRRLSGMPLKARRLLEAGFVVRSTKVEERHDSSDGSTTKLVIRLLRDNLPTHTHTQSPRHTHT